MIQEKIELEEENPSHPVKHQKRTKPKCRVAAVDTTIIRALKNFKPPGKTIKSDGRVIANNSLLKKNKRQKSEDEQPAPDPLEKRKESFSEEEDFYLDIYKQDNALFTLLYDENILSIEELFQDSVSAN